MKFLTLFWFSMSLFITGCDQFCDVRGTILDKSTGLPLKNVLIYRPFFKDSIPKPYWDGTLETRSYYCTRTDDSGRYRLDYITGFSDCSVTVEQQNYQIAQTTGGIFYLQPFDSLFDMQHIPFF